MELQAIPAIGDISAAQWNALAGTDNPFLRHEFLSALETHGAVSRENGWAPHHLLLWQDGELMGAAPAYLKGNSRGEFVFDFAWAHAYERNGLAYYPKLIIAVPYSPINGPRMLLAPGYPAEGLRQALADGARQMVEEMELSSVHWLFADAKEIEALQDCDYSLRLGCQYHWYNAGYADFDDFLAGMSSKKRKNIRRERRRVSDQGLHLRTLHGDEIEPDLWDALHGFYAKTFYEHGNLPVISRDCFAELGKQMTDRMVVFVAEDAGRPVAAAICFRSSDTLFGRYWGSERDYDGLHFEACYYQGIEYCIRHGLTRFEPGAQGEHKVPRGFLPTLTRSAHHLTDARFRAAVDDFLDRERPAVHAFAADLMRDAPFREEVLEQINRD
ncbi:GNAT family N-acetyltransferase [Spiribacter sp. 2438]|uniref:GNAT family N-acetyltransferase n=1 Tax=Spiribacter sp. 2438 TaxID=2666185 RepID=UPI0012B15B10|nr:GNAT family N-acetyltransferase [Spiribacter sp. 2438]QGM21970.1 GNAT family N-acetyltransferase [Spiribacter sp. 2438]